MRKRHGHSLSFVNYQKLHQQLVALYPRFSDRYNRSLKTFLKEGDWKILSSLNSPAIDKADLEWWIAQREDPESCVSHLLEHPSEAVDLGKILTYKSGNYVFDDSLYQRLHRLALENKITLMQLDIAKEEDVQALQGKLESLKHPVSLIDFDNLYHYHYLGEPTYKRALSSLLPLGRPNSVLIVMGNYLKYACAQFSIYLGFTFENTQHCGPMKYSYGLCLNRFLTSLRR